MVTNFINNRFNNNGRDFSNSSSRGSFYHHSHYYNNHSYRRNRNYVDRTMESYTCEVVKLLLLASLTLLFLFSSGKKVYDVYSMNDSRRGKIKVNFDYRVCNTLRNQCAHNSEKGRGITLS